MGYVTPEQISKAKEIDLLTYLQRCDPHELVHVSGVTYCTREHDSLKISKRTSLWCVETSVVFGTAMSGMTRAWTGWRSAPSPRPL